jgi:hypothetical protein
LRYEAATTKTTATVKTIKINKMKVTQNGKVTEGKLIITDETQSAKLKIIVQTDNGSILMELSQMEFDFLKSEVNDR